MLSSSTSYSPVVMTWRAPEPFEKSDQSEYPTESDQRLLDRATKALRVYNEAYEKYVEKLSEINGKLTLAIKEAKQAIKEAKIAVALVAIAFVGVAIVSSPPLVLGWTAFFGAVTFLAITLVMDMYCENKVKEKKHKVVELQRSLIELPNERPKPGKDIEHLQILRDSANRENS